MADLSKLIDTALLEAFGQETIVPIKGTIAALALAVDGLSSTKVDGISYDPQTGVLSVKSGDDVVGTVTINGGVVTGKLSEEYANFYGAKNLLRYPYEVTTRTSNGITFTDNGDGTVTCNGTATATAGFVMYASGNENFKLPTGNYRLTGCPDGGSSTTYRIQMAHSGTVDTCDTGDGANFTLNNEEIIGIAIYVYKNTTVNDLTFKPMIRLASISDDSWQPYIPTNKELTDKINDSIAGITNVYGAKNLLPYPYYQTTQTVDGITVTDNGDGSLTLNGTSTRSATKFRYTPISDGIVSIPLDKAKYILSFGADDSTAAFHFGDIRLLKTDGTAESRGKVTKDQVIDNTTGIYKGIDAMSIYIANNTTLNNVTLYPMLRLASIEDDTWVPYVPTNKELSENKADGIYYDEENSELQLKSGNAVIATATIEGGSVKSQINITNSTRDLAGETVTVSIAGETVATTTFSVSYTASVKVGLIGTYTITCGTYSTTVNVSTLGALYTADIQTQKPWEQWCEAGGVSTSTYNSLSDVLADEKAIRKLMTIHAAVDWLAETNTDTELIETIINDDYCAKWINLRDYALDTLYANEDIAALMDAADKYFYGEWALMPQVPIMTSNTAPYGEAFASSEFSDAYKAFKAFNGHTPQIEGEAWSSANTGVADTYIGYKFSRPVCIKKVKIGNGGNTNGRFIATSFKVQASIDNINWVDISDVFIVKDSTQSAISDYNINNNESYYSYRIKILSIINDEIRCGIQLLQFYAWQPKGNVPVMTSNTAPYGEVISSGEYSSTYPGWQVFDNNPSSWWVGTRTTDGYIGYKFTNPVCVRCFEVSDLVLNADVHIKNFRIEGSNDGVTFTSIFTGIVQNQRGVYRFSFPNSSYYIFYRLFVIDEYNTATNIQLVSLQFYGRELKVSVPTMTSNTEPWGAVFGDNPSDSTYGCLRAFDNDSSTKCMLWATTAGTKEIGYQFITQILPKMVIGTVPNESNVYPTSITVKGSNDGETYTDIGTFSCSNLSVLASEAYILNASSSYKYIKLVCTLRKYSSTEYYAQFSSIQIYGLDYSEYDWDQDNPRHYIYDHGVELESMDTTGYTQSGSGHFAGTITKKDDCINLYAPCGGVWNENHYAIVGTLSTVDITNYSILRFVVQLKTQNINQTGGAITSKNFGAGYDPVAQVAFSAGSYPQIGVDISSVSGTYYIFDRAFTYDGNSNMTQENDLVELWLE